MDDQCWPPPLLLLLLLQSNYNPLMRQAIQDHVQVQGVAAALELGHH